MKIEYKKKFLKELAKIPSKFRSPIEEFVFEELPSLESIIRSKKIEKMKGYSNHYKIRFGNYRVGLKTEKDTVILERVLHRRDIYRYYP
ncbi:MAG: type II toxin-antitoxin system RelE/ParE family toxin [Ignavibacteria bacterium]|nr:type II toxin-antitoxin system RelE/ParE family toxin [Ignavibacteria bacterium]